jgi:hypothetical protein
MASGVQLVAWPALVGAFGSVLTLSDFT